ncbi:hypothetical protein [Butyrivibrio sp. AE2032]|uniref:hypothetical protein n=1 Tax=Butyrivibrio sp. AE2032 TaxID=1458463 RepID=UPI000555BB1B|nr:hypothetical protein [Butyrivibrio sp. AE2032]
MRRFLSVAAVLSLCVFLVCSCTEKEDRTYLYNNTDYEDRYNDAMDLLYAGEYRAARDGFDLLNGYGDSIEMRRQANACIIRSEGVSEGEIIEFGDYNGCINWLVLEVKGNKALIISEDVISRKELNRSIPGWETGAIREWLNGTYADETFTDFERSVIADVKTEKVFILTKNEAQEYFDDEEDIDNACGVSGIRPAVWIELSDMARNGSAEDSVETSGTEMPDDVRQLYDYVYENINLMGTVIEYPVRYDVNKDGYEDLCATVTTGSGIVTTFIAVYDVRNGKGYMLNDRTEYDYRIRGVEGDDLTVVRQDYQGGRGTVVSGTVGIENGELVFITE